MQQTLKRIDLVSVQSKKVLVRIDANVEIDANGDVRERYKLESARKTVQYLVKQGVKVALLTHFGRPEGKRDERFSVRCLTDDLERALGVSVRFVGDCVSAAIPEALEQLAPNQVLLLENVRFMPGEEANNAEFARQLAAPFDLFVNEAFSVCHRDQASVTGVTRFLPSVAGFHILEEVERLSAVLHAPERPAVAIIGGAKIETKLPVLKAFEDAYDVVLVGSKIADEAMAQEMTFSDKVVFPADFAEGHLDIGLQAIEQFVARIRGAKTLVWNGPVGKFEQPPFDAGTRAIALALAESEAMTVVGGGESVQVLEEWHLFDRMSFVSTGGGAMLDFLGGAPMPGLEALRKKR